MYEITFIQMKLCDFIHFSARNSIKNPQRFSQGFLKNKTTKSLYRVRQTRKGKIPDFYSRY